MAGWHGSLMRGKDLLFNKMLLLESWIFKWEKLKLYSNLNTEISFNLYTEISSECIKD